jgi:hypothetical protein
MPEHNLLKSLKAAGFDDVAADYAKSQPTTTPEFDDLFAKTAKLQSQVIKKAWPLILGVVVVQAAMFCGAVYFVFWAGHSFGVW